MANIKIPRKEIEKEIKLNKEIEEKISLFGTPLESVNGEEIEIEVFPNRPDLLSMQGFLRAFKQFLGKDPGLKKYRINKPEKDYRVIIDSSVKSVRPFTACTIIKNLNLDEEKLKEIIDLQEKLHSTLGRNRKKLAIGIYPLEKISLPIRYEARKPKDIVFKPLDSERDMNGKEILERHPTGKEYSNLLQNYREYPLFIDSKGKVLSMPPIINSEETGRVNKDTKEIFVECSGHDLDSLKKALNILTATLADMGGKIYQMTLEYGKEKIITPDFTPKKTKISLENTNSLLGLNLKEREMEKLLQKMGHECKNSQVYSPAWRTDILHEVDLIEDVAIAYGYNNLIPEIPQVATNSQESKDSIIKRKLSEALVGLGLLEISTFHLIKEDEAKKMKLKELIELENAKTEYKLLRPNLLISTLRILADNKDHEYPQKVFEIGRIFEKDKKSGISESENLIIATTPGNFTEIKQTLNFLFDQLQLNYELKETEDKSFIEGRTGKILLNKKEIGIMGELNPNTLRAFNIKMPISTIEISLEEIFKSLENN